MTAHPHPVDQHVGQRLRLRRSLLGMSQERLGERLGLTFQQVQKYERGSNRIGASRLFEVAAILDVPVTWFFEGFGPERKDDDAPAVNGSGKKPCARGRIAANGHLNGKANHEAGDAAISGRETLELVRAFNRIGDPLVRRRLYELTRVLADLAYRTPDRPT